MVKNDNAIKQISKEFGHQLSKLGSTIQNDPEFQRRKGDLDGKLDTFGKNQGILKSELDSLLAERADIDKLSNQPGVDIDTLFKRNEIFQARSEDLLG
jgi:hypothetical protein